MYNYMPICYYLDIHYQYFKGKVYMYSQLQLEEDLSAQKLLSGKAQSQRIFRKNDYEKSSLSHESLTKYFSLFTPTKQTFFVPGTTSLGPHLKPKKQSNKSVLYYLAPHNLVEYFASEILLRIGILTPKCRILTGEEEENPLVPYEIIMISLDEDEKIEDSKLYKIATSRGNRPILIKHGKQILLYGTPNASQWEISLLESDVFSELEFRLPGDYPYIMSSKLVTPSMYKEIALKKAHIPPLIASKSIDGFIPIDLVRRFGRRGDRLGPRNFDYLRDNESSKYLKDRYELDIEKQIVYDHVEKKNYRISGNLFGSDIAALLICDYDFQSDGQNFGIVKVGARFYAAAIDKEAAKFEGKSYQELAKILSDRFINDFLYKSRMDDQVIAVVYQIAQALTQDIRGQCDFDRIFSNPRVNATHQLFMSPDERCANVKKTAASIVEHYQHIYGETFLEKYSDRDTLRKQIAYQVMANIDCSDCTHNYEAIKHIIVEDLRGPYYRHLFSDQSKQLISNSDIDNSELLKVILTDVVEEYGLSICNKGTSLQSW